MARTYWLLEETPTGYRLERGGAEEILGDVDVPRGADPGEVAAAVLQCLQEGGAALLAELEQLDLSGRGDEARETCRREVEYVRHNVHRMDYPRYLAQGWQIGSGPVEAACKTVVGQRLKGSGMRWGDDGADAVCALRAVYLSDQALWESRWRRPPASPHITPEVYLQN